MNEENFEQRYYYNYKPKTKMLLYPLLTDTSAINAELHLTYLKAFLPLYC